MNAKDYKYAEICEINLSRKEFCDYQQMLKDWLAQEQSAYLNYHNKTATPEREDAELREFRGALRMLERIINRPEELKSRLRQERERAAKKRESTNLTVAKQGG